MKKNKKLKISEFFRSYLSKLNNSINLISLENLEQASKLILNTIKKDKVIYVCGNGGSAAISNHYVCDYLKFLRQKTNLKPKIVSLANNIETLTAISNDLSYDQIFEYLAQNMCSKGDLLIIISSSGNSKNIKKIINFSKKKKIKTIGFSGFDGGYLEKNASISIHVPAMNYGVSEDSHHILMHVLLQFIIYESSYLKK